MAATTTKATHAVPEGGHFHAVRFYDNERSLCRIVASFLREGLALGQPALVFATTAHAQGILAELRAREVDVAALAESNDLVMVDAVETLASFILDGLPNPAKFFRSANDALDRARQQRKNVTIHAYGEMADVLWKEGHDVAAIQLEILWNRLARNSEFELLCGHAMGGFLENASVKDVCRQHTHLVNADGTAHVSNVDTLLVD